MTSRDRNILFAGIGVSVGLVLVVVLVSPKKRIALPPTGPFDSPDRPGSGRCMDPAFLRMLQALERKTGYPVFRNINSGARSPVHNSNVGGVTNSSHKIPTCKAADIRTPSREIQRKLAYAAKAVGFRRIGIGKTFIHLDNDSDKSQNVSWGYPKGTPPPFNVFLT